MKNERRPSEKTPTPPPDQPKNAPVQDPGPAEKGAYFQGRDRTQTDANLASEEDE